jgi:hypothetical protein
MKKVAKEGLDLTVQRPGRQFIKQLHGTFEDTIVDAIIGAQETKLQSATLVRNLGVIREVIGQKQYRMLGEKLKEKVFSIHPETEFVQPKTFVRLFDKYKKRVFTRFDSPHKVEQLERLRNIAARIETAETIAGNPSGTGQTVVTWGLARFIIQNPRSGAIISVGPKYLSKLYTSNFGIKWLTDGFKVPANTKEGAALFTKLASMLGIQEGQEQGIPYL